MPLSYSFYFETYDAEMHLSDSNCPNETIFEPVFALEHFPALIAEHYYLSKLFKKRNGNIPKSRHAKIRFLRTGIKGFFLKKGQSQQLTLAQCFGMEVFG